MDGGNEVGYKPPAEFEEVVNESLLDISLTDSKELWLIQWPHNHPPDFEGKEVSLKLHHDGQLGSFEGLSGKSYDVVSFAAQDPDATVFVSSASESKIVGKISRRVSLVHYPEPNELVKPDADNLKQMYQRSGATTLTNSSHHLRTPMGSSKLRNSGSASKHASSSRSGKQKSSFITGGGEPSKSSKRRHIREATGSMDQSTKDSGRGHSTVTSGSLEHSREIKKLKS